MMRRISAGTRLEDWLSAFLDAKGGVTGGPLYSYRCSVHEFEALTAILGEALSEGLLSLRVQGAAAFCLFISEWWRREYSGGGWSWQSIFERLNHRDSFSLQPLYRTLVKGMSFWERKILVGTGGRMFLATLAIEGGLPLSLVKSEGTNLRRYFRRLIERLNSFAFATPEEDILLAEQSAGYLPISFREREVYDLTARMTRRVIEWQDQMKWDGRGDALAVLERAVPAWRDEFPLDVGEAVALDLLQGLVKDAKTASKHRLRPLRLQTTLLPLSQGQWSLVRTASLPRAIDAQRLAQAFDVATDVLPNRFQFQACDSREVRHAISMATPLSGGRFLLEKTGSEDLTLLEPALTAALELHITVGFETLKAIVPMGWEALEADPWLFEEAEPGRYAFAGQGNTSIQSTEGLVAVPEGTTLRAIGPDATIEPMGELNRASRSVFRICGEVAWRDEASDEEGVLRTGVEQAEALSYQLRGARLKGALTHERAFTGQPSLRILSEDSGIHDVPASALEWRPRGSRGAWRRMGPTCLGTVQLRYCREDRTLFRTRATILPESSSVQIEVGETSADGQRHSGRVIIRNLGALSVTVEPPDLVETHERSSRREETFELVSGRDAPRSLTLRATWPHGADAQIHLPFPAAVARFTNLATGRVLDEHERLHWEAIGSLRAEAWSPRFHERFEVAAQLSGDRDNNAATRQSAGFFIPLRSDVEQYQLDLVHVAARCRRMLSITNSPDVTISLKLKDRSGRQRHAITLAKFLGQIDPVVDNEVYALKEDREQEVVPEESGPLRVEALALWDPAGLRLPLEPVGPNRWRLPTGEMPSGHWLLIGWEGQACRFRPRVVSLASSIESPDSRTPFQETASISERKARLRALRRFIEQLMDCPDDSAWDELAQYLDAVSDLPPELFDVIDCLMAQPHALAMVMARLSHPRFRQLWACLEQTPMDWALMPAGAWFRAFGARMSAMRETLKDIGVVDVTGICEGHLRPYLEHMSSQIQGLHSIEVMVLNQQFGIETSGNSLIRAGLSSTRPVLLPLRQAEREQLLRRQANTERWPEWPLGWQNWASALLEALEDRSERMNRELLAALWQNSDADYRQFVLNLPALAAMSSVLGRTPTREQVLRVRQVRDFDPDWFECAYTVALALLLGNLPELATGGDR